MPETVDASIAENLLHVKIIQPKRGSKKDLLELANKNATFALQEKFSLIERDEERTIKAVENFGGSWVFIHPIALKPLIIPIFKGQIPFRRWLYLLMGNQKNGNTANIK